MRNLYIAYVRTLPAALQDEIAARYGDGDALDGKVCDLMSLGEWRDLYTEINLTPAALDALSVILDINDDDDALTEAGVNAEGLALLRAIVAR